MVGIDTLHRIDTLSKYIVVFMNNVYVLENLTNLEQLLNAGRFEVIAFPLDNGRQFHDRAV